MKLAVFPICSLKANAVIALVCLLKLKCNSVNIIKVLFEQTLSDSGTIALCNQFFAVTLDGP